MQFNLEEDYKITLALQIQGDKLSVVGYVYKGQELVRVVATDGISCYVLQDNTWVQSPYNHRFKNKSKYFYSSSLNSFVLKTEASTQDKAVLCFVSSLSMVGNHKLFVNPSFYLLLEALVHDTLDRESISWFQGSRPGAQIIFDGKSITITFGVPEEVDLSLDDNSLRQLFLFPINIDIIAKDANKRLITVKTKLPRWNYEELTLPILKDLARGKDLKGYSKLKKDLLIKLLRTNI